jgi:hypothetical protein
VYLQNCRRVKEYPLVVYPLCTKITAVSKTISFSYSDILQELPALCFGKNLLSMVEGNGCDEEEDDELEALVDLIDLRGGCCDKALMCLLARLPDLDCDISCDYLCIKGRCKSR